MSYALRFNGSTLAWIHSYSDEDSTKFNVVMNDIGALEQLCGLSNNEFVEVDGMSSMNYRQFKDEIVSRIKRIYLSANEYNLDLHSK
ncbi:hypothetical protein COU57_04935 [Candidatus Pacearchaeota archaeon CG10_big_fil_rev_8_21_14_0_10_32_14]|nr:MAG: hypothetical protein COU57_04935 [Candidatus Pacearchaeota archaeon CG10_big_fil_rev_8_21_14_0_10_32_14]